MTYKDCQLPKSISLRTMKAMISEDTVRLSKETGRTYACLAQLANELAVQNQSYSLSDDYFNGLECYFKQCSECICLAENVDILIEYSKTPQCWANLL